MNQSRMRLQKGFLLRTKAKLKFFARQRKLRKRRIKSFHALWRQKFAREWLRLEPPLGDMDLRPILHLSRDSTIRDFGADELNAAGKALRDSLVSARTSNDALKQQIRERPGIFNLVLLWRGRGIQRRSGRTWQKHDEILMLTEVCRIHPSAGPRQHSLVKRLSLSLLPDLFLLWRTVIGQKTFWTSG